MVELPDSCHLPALASKCRATEIPAQAWNKPLWLDLNRSLVTYSKAWERSHDYAATCFQADRSLQIRAADPVRYRVEETSGMMLMSELHILHQDPHRAGRAAKRSAARSDTDSVSDSSFLRFLELPLAVQSKIASHMTLADLRAFSEASTGMYRQEFYC